MASDDAAALAWAARAAGGGSVVSATLFPAATSSTVLAVDVALPDGTVRALVLRRFTNAAWLAEEDDVPGAEAAALRVAAACAVPTPTLVALERDAGPEPWLLMTRLPGAPRAPSADDAFLAPLAALLAPIHATPVSEPLRPYDPWEREAAGPPPWTARPELWDAAFARFAAPAPPLPPGTAPVLLHRDFHPGNVLWEGDAISGVVDWPSASVGHPHADPGHCRMDLARTVGLPAADRFLQLAGIPRRDYDPYWDLAAVLGGFTEDDWSPADEAFVAQAVARLPRA